MPFLSKFGNVLRTIGEKAAAGTQWLGHKTADALTAVAPVAAAINPTLGAGVAGAAAVARGVGQVGDWGQRALSSGAIDTGQLRGTINKINGDAAAVRAAYNRGKGILRSAIER